MKLLHFFFGEGKRENKFGSHTFRTDDIDMFFMSLNDFFDNGKSKSGSLFVFASGGIDLIETLPDFFQAFTWNTNS